MAKKLSEMTLEELWQLFPVFLVEPRAGWAESYARQAAELQKIMPYAVIGHIGSTAIKGIMAKNIVDILAELPAGCNMDAVCSQLVESGWICMSRKSGRISLNRGYTPEGFADEVYHLHLRYAGDHDEVYFRDYMNSHPEAAREYEKLKLGLWKRFEHDRDGYTDAKTEFVKKYTAIAKIRFEHIENAEFAEYAEKLFKILYENMSEIAPSGMSMADEYDEWLRAVGSGMKKPQRRIILIKCIDEIIGFFQYYVNNGVFMMEEIQLMPEYQGKYGIFRMLYEYLIPLIPADTQYVKAFAHRRNEKSDVILRHMGLKMTADGEIRAYCGDYTEFLKWYEKSRS